MSEINIESNEESDSTSVKCKAIITEIMPTMPSIYNESKFDPNITCVFAAIQVNYNAVTKNDIVSNVSDCSVATKNDIVSNVNDCSAAIKKNIVCSINNYLTKLGEGQYPVDDKPHGLRDFFSNHAEMNTLADVINEYCPFLKGTILYYDANSELNAKDLAFAIGCNIMIFVAVNVNINYQTLTSPSSSSSSSSSSSPFSSPSSSSSSSSQYKPNKWMSLDGNMKKNNRAVKELLGANPITSRNENGNVTLEIPERIIEIMQNGNAAVIVDNKGNIISEGRDGFAYGLTEEELNKGGFDLCPGDRELLWVSAIKNAILFYLQKNRIITENTLLFVTHKPCFNCGKT
ncbi:MAG: hypothetical protein LBB09_00320, partial [Rickettsiales bacterium]|nr:hypothetical protein [Rickettsiales bacterium]